MYLFRCARILNAKAKGSPAEDVLPFAQPKYHLPALGEAVNAYNSRAAPGGLGFVDIFCGKSDIPRATASWKSRAHPAGSPDPPVSDRAAGVLEEVLKAVKGG